MLHRQRFALSFLLAIAGATAQTPLRTELVTSALSTPVLATAPPGDFDRLFVVEQRGVIRIVRNGVLLAQPFLDLTANFQVLFGGEAGLLGLAFHPNYRVNGKFYIYLSTFPFIIGVLRQYQVSTNPDVANPASALDILSVPGVFGNHNGGMIAFGADGFLYAGVGDGGSQGPADPFNHAQRGDSLGGKMLRIDVDNPNPPLNYGIPASNPFAGPGDPRDEIWAFGLRNPWRWSFDRLTGDMYIADVGGGREEVDFEPAGSPGGRNYGWSCMGGTVCENLPACMCGSPTLTLPIYEYTNATGRAIIGGYVYRGAAIPDLRGTYFLADYRTGEVWSFRRSGASVTQLTNRTAELAPPAQLNFMSIAGFGEDGRGELYICELGGRLYRIVPTSPVLTGLSPYGMGRPGCAGTHVLDAASSPVLGNAAFELRCSNASTQAVGIIAVGFSPDVAGSDPLGLGINLHVQLPSLVLTQLVLSDANGVGRFPFPIPGASVLIGLNLFAQMGWFWPPAVCSPTPSGWSSSHALAITLQP